MLENRRSGHFMDHRGKEYSKSALNERGYWMTSDNNIINRSDVARFQGFGIANQQQYEEYRRGERSIKFGLQKSED